MEIERYILESSDLNGIPIQIGNKHVILDRYGVILFNEYKWYITFTNWYLHRWEPNTSGKLVAFHRQLLGLHDTNEHVKFANGNRLDCRIVNLRTRLRSYYIDREVAYD